MSEMVERVARAIYEASPHEDAGEAIDGFQVTPPSVLRWDQICESGWDEDFKSLARAAIEAMREPTEAMVRAGAMCLDARFCDDKQPLSRLGSERPCGCAERWRKSWASAHDAAVK